MLKRSSHKRNHENIEKLLQPMRCKCDCPCIKESTSLSQHLCITPINVLKRALSVFVYAYIFFLKGLRSLTFNHKFYFYFYLFLFYAFSLVHWNFQCLDPPASWHICLLFYFSFFNQNWKKKSFDNKKNYFMFSIIKNKNMMFLKTYFNCFFVVF